MAVSLQFDKNVPIKNKIPELFIVQEYCYVYCEIYMAQFTTLNISKYMVPGV